MEKRLQTVNGDTVLEITEDKPTKTRLSENALLRQKEYLEQNITTFQAALAETNELLALITTEKNAAESKS